MTKLGRTQVDAIVAQLVQIKHDFNRQIEELITGLQGDGRVRGFRHYDIPTPDPTEIADKYGVDLDDDPDAQPPEWFQTRFGHHTNHPENE